MNTLNNKNLSNLNGKTLYQIDLLNKETGYYLDPIYISAYSDDEASEKAYEFDGPVFKVKGIHSDWMDEKVLDEEKLEMANPPQTKWKWENGIGELRVQ